MSFHHKSRIKTPIDYSFVVSDMGGCCLPNDKDPTATTYQNCMENDGLFVPTDYDGNGNPIMDEIICPHISTKGCCCACNYVDDDDYDAFFEDVGSDMSGNADPGSCGDDGEPLSCYQGGTRDNITKCECDRLDGVWGVGECSTLTNGVQVLCTNSFTQKDVRWPGACCVEGNCNNSCSAQDCSDIEESNEDTQWRPNEICGFSPGGPETSDCSSGNYKSAGVRDISTGILIVNQRPQKEDTSQNDNINIISDTGSCCVYEDEYGNTTCSLLNEEDCNSYRGIWSGVDSEGDLYYCDSTKCNEALDVFANDGSISSSYVDGWKLGELVFGGRYVGTFNVQSSHFGSGSVCFGNTDTGPAHDYTAIGESNNNENIKTKYAVVVANRDLFINKVVLDSRNISKTVISDNSSWDINQNNDSWTNHIQYGINSKKPQNLNWTVPSRDVLAFAYRQMQDLEFITNTTFSNNPKHMKKQYYWTNTFYGKKIRSKTYAYIQSFTEDSLVGIQPTTDFAFVRSFLLIPIK
jgi:hypothetical protein